MLGSCLRGLCGAQETRDNLGERGVEPDQPVGLARKQGTFVYYRLSDPDVFALARMIRTLAERHLAEVDQIVRTYFHARDELEPVDRETLLARARAGEVVVLDARPPEEYRAGHIAGSSRRRTSSGSQA